MTAHSTRMALKIGWHKRWHGIKDYGIGDGSLGSDGIDEGSLDLDDIEDGINDLRSVVVGGRQLLLLLLASTAGARIQQSLFISLLCKYLEEQLV
jgi:hypothetical protein